MRKLRQLMTIRTMILCSILMATAFTVVMAQDGEPPAPVEPSAIWEFIALTVNGGVVVALLQLFRRLQVLTLIPAFARPLIAGGLGVGVAWLTNYVGANFGVQLDLSAIVSFFAVGGGAAALFDIGKEAGVLNSSG